MPPAASPPRPSFQRPQPEPVIAVPRAAARGGGPSIAILLPALAAAALVAAGIADRSLWLDEGATVAIASQRGAALWHAIGHDGGNMLLYYLLMHAVIGAFGTGEVVLRLPSLIGDVATASLTALLALRLLRDWRVALGAGLLSAVSLPLVFWGQDARGYALMVALASASFLAFLSLLGSPSPATVAAYVLSTALALYFGFDAGLVVLAELAVLATRRERAGPVIGCLVAIAAACVPLA